LGTQLALQIRDYLLEGVIRNACESAGAFGGSIPAACGHTGMGERLVSLVSQAADSLRRGFASYCGALTEVGHHRLRSAVLVARCTPCWIK